MFRKALPQIILSRSIRATQGNGRLSSTHRLLVLLAFLSLGTPGVHAQEPATSLDQLNLILGNGDKITLVDSSGQKVTARVNRLGPDGLDLNVSDKVRTFTENEIRQITRGKSDSPLNGFLIGAGTGFGLTLPLNLALVNDDEKGAAVAASALWGLIGGGIGALVDACVHGEQLVYFRPRSNVSWSISPFSGPLYKSPRRGIQASWVDSSPGTGANSSTGLRVTVRF